MSSYPPRWWGGYMLPTVRTRKPLRVSSTQEARWVVRHEEALARPIELEGRILREVALDCGIRARSRIRAWKLANRQPVGDPVLDHEIAPGRDERPVAPQVGKHVLRSVARV